MKYLVGAEMMAFNAAARKLNAAYDQKELGLYATELNNADLLVLARDVAKLLACQYGSVTIDLVRQHESLQGHQPSSPNFWGTIFNEKGWRFVKYEPSQLRSNHHRRIARWEWKP